MDEAGEEIVVSAIVLRVISAILISRPYESISIFALATVGLIAESFLRQKQIEGLKSRPGVSTGILLGSITWPLVLSSGSTYAFWSALLCNLRIMCYISSKHNKAAFVTRLESFLTFKTSALLFVFFVILARITELQRWLFVSVICVQIFASGIFLQQIMGKFSGCTSPGEAALFASGFALYTGNMFLELLLAVFNYPIQPQTPVERMLQVGVLGLSLMPPLYKSFMLITGKGTSFVASILFIVLIIAPMWLYFLVGLRQHPVLWVLEFVLEKPLRRFGLCLYWIIILCILPYLYRIAKQGYIAQIIVRKGYHVLSVLMFVPAILIDREFMHLAFTVALVVFGLVEMVRIWQVPPVGPKIMEFMAVFTDQRDSNKLIISHFSLLLGCALPLWLHSNAQMRPLAPFAGILSIGIGDTMASYIGYKYGFWRLTRTSKKTVEGTAAGIMSLLVSCYLLQRFLHTECSQIAVAAVFAGLVEAYTSQLDNVFVPLVFYTLLFV